MRVLPLEQMLKYSPDSVTLGEVAIPGELCLNLLIYATGKLACLEIIDLLRQQGLSFSQDEFLEALEYLENNHLIVYYKH